MKKIDFGQTLAIFANAGVILGIVFLALEMRQNTTAIEVGPMADLEPEDASMAGGLILMIFRHGDMAYHQYERGLISEELLDSALGVLVKNVCLVKFREVWSNLRESFVATYRAHIDDKILEC